MFANDEGEAVIENTVRGRFGALVRVRHSWPSVLFLRCRGRCQESQPGKVRCAVAD